MAPPAKVIVARHFDHVQQFATDWMWTYNHDRPNMALGGLTPKQRPAMAA
ncbi:integrase core domain-containing protein [Mycetohabitans sp. B8]|nr:integrase core domain-containing protein [Mycetohabitans sp. B8]